MNIVSVQGLLLLGALVFACAVFVPILAGRYLIGSYTVPNAGGAIAKPWGIVGAPPTARAQPRSGVLPVAPRGFGPRPSSSVADWAVSDARIRRSVILDSTAGPAYNGQFRCQCDGTRRYNLDRSAHSALWRCLHCGDLHSGHDVIPEEDD
jgi:hypothetical protein